MHLNAWTNATISVEAFFLLELVDSVWQCDTQAENIPNAGETCV